jgi:hypothetical protein
MSWFSKLGVVSVDLSALLDRQLELTSQGLHQLEAWCRNPSQELMDEVFRLETEGDGARAALATGLAAAFETPLDREDLNDLSRRIDDLLDEARSMVRLGTALKVAPEANVCDMVANLHQGVEHLRQAIQCLPKRAEEADKFARQARRPLRLNERLYSSGVALLYDGEDLKYIFRQMELYHAVIRLSEVEESLADQLDHAIYKLT